MRWVDFQGQIPEPANFDLVVCILWSRLGSRLHPGMHRRADGSTYASGTEYEFTSAMNAFKNSGRPDMLVYRRTARPVTPLDPPDEIELRLSQWKAEKAHWDDDDEWRLRTTRKLHRQARLFW